MTSFPRLICFAFLASSTMFTSLAWVSRPPSTVTMGSRATTATRLYMFDWFNPKPAPKPQETMPEVPPAAAPAAAAAVVVVEQQEQEHVVAKDTTSTSSASSASTLDAIHVGTVDWYDRKKGFGFIKASDGRKDESIFVHQSQIQMEGYRCLVDGEKVEYRLEVDEKGRARALHVTGPQGGDVKISKRRNDRKANWLATSE